MGRRMTPLFVIGFALSALALGGFLYQILPGHRIAFLISQPAVWLVTVSVACTIGLYAYYEQMIANKIKDTETLRFAHDSQVDKLISESSRMDQLNFSYSETIDNLEDEIAQLKIEESKLIAAHASEKSEMNQHIVAAVQGQVEANTRQMEALNLAMQYQRGELKEMRHQLRDTQTRVSDMLRIDSPPEQTLLPSVATTNLPADDEALTSWRVRL